MTSPPNGGRRADVLNDTFELWSLPWHALHRDLAKSFGPEPAVVPSAGLKLMPAPAASAAAAGSWLRRAYSRREASPAPSFR